MSRSRLTAGTTSWQILATEGRRPRYAEKCSARILSVTVVHLSLTWAGIGAAVGAAVPILTLVLGLPSRLPGFTARGRAASRIKEIITIIDDVAQHSEEADNAKRRLQEQLDALVLRYVALTAI